MPAISTRHVFRSITNSTKYRTKPCLVNTSTVKKSVRSYGSPVSLQERTPGHSFTSFIRGLEPMLPRECASRCCGRRHGRGFEERRKFSYSPKVEFSVAILTTSSRIVSSTRGRPGPRRRLPSYFFAISSLYQRNKVSGVTRPAISFRPSLPNVLAFAASRRRCASVKRSRRPLSCSRRTRFSSFRYSIASCWNRLTHPAKAMTKNCHRYGCMGSDSSRPSSPAGLLLEASTTCQHSASGVDRVLAHYGVTTAPAARAAACSSSNRCMRSTRCSTGTSGNRKRPEWASPFLKTSSPKSLSIVMRMRCSVDAYSRIASSPGSSPRSADSTTSCPLFRSHRASRWPAHRSTRNFTS